MHARNPAASSRRTVTDTRESAGVEPVRTQLADEIQDEGPGGRIVARDGDHPAPGSPGWLAERGQAGRADGVERLDYEMAELRLPRQDAGGVLARLRSEGGVEDRLAGELGSGREHAIAVDGQRPSERPGDRPDDTALPSSCASWHPRLGQAAGQTRSPATRCPGSGGRTRLRPGNRCRARCHRPVTESRRAGPVAGLMGTLPPAAAPRRRRRACGRYGPGGGRATRPRLPQDRSGAARRGSLPAGSTGPPDRVPRAGRRYRKPAGRLRLP
jgi:hypothetical protein